MLYWKTAVVSTLAFVLCCGEATTSAASSQPSVPHRVLLAQSANPRSAAWELYKAKDYQAAIEQFNVALLDNQNDPKMYWGLTLAHNKLQQYALAKASLDKAVEIDPTLGFTSQDSYEKLRATISRNLDKVVADPIPTLKDSAVFVESSMALKVDQGTLAQTAQELEPFRVKFAVLDKVEGDRRSYAKELFDYLNLKDAAVIVATQKGVDLYSDRISDEKSVELAKRSRIEFEQNNYTQGLSSLAKNSAQVLKDQKNQRNTLIGGAIATLAVGAGGFTLSRRKRRGQQLDGLKQRHANIAATLDDVQSYLKVLPERSPQAERLYQQASTAFIQASDQLDSDTPDLIMVEQQLGQAQQSLGEARKEIDRATGAPPDPSIHKSEQTGACFFCSRPQLMDQLKPHLIQQKSLQKQVLCCSACLAQLTSGQTPKVRTRKKNGRYVPWYSDRSYDPYRDYYQYDQDWHYTTVYEVEFEKDDEVVIYPEQEQYRDYQVDQVYTDSSDFASSSEPEVIPEASTETDFYWADDADSSPDVADASGDPGFFDSDIS